MRKRAENMTNSKLTSLYPRESYDIFEGLVSIRAVFEAIDTKISDRKIISVLFAEEKIKGNGRLLGFLKARSFTYGYELKTVPEAEINTVSEGSSHGGIIMITEKRIYPERITTVTENGFAVILDGIEDPYNLGYAIRSVYAAGADTVLLPKRSPIISAGIVCRSSAGASELINTVCGDLAENVTLLKDSGYRLVCADMDAPAPAHLSNLKKPLILAVGGEKRGFSKKLTSLSDLTVRLDYGRDFKMALSAASASAVLAFEVTKQNP